MASDASYSYSLTTFSRSGKLLQIEYALTAVGEGKTSIGIKAKNGVVLITDKKIQNKLVDTAQVKKLEQYTAIFRPNDKASIQTRTSWARVSRAPHPGQPPGFP